MQPDNLVISVLKEIRDGVHQTNERLDQTNERLDQTNERLDQTNERLDQNNERLGHVEGTLLELSQQQACVVRWLKATSRRDRHIEREVEDLRSRVSTIEAQLTEP